MANVNRSQGFRPVKYLSGKCYSGAFNWYEIPAADTSVTMVGDLVVLSDGAATEAYPAVERAAASGAVTAAVLVGAIVGMYIDPTNLNVPGGMYRVTAVKRLVMVADDRDLVFECQEDSVGGAIATASIGLNAGFVATAGSTTTGNSGMELDSSSVDTTSTLPLQIVGRSERIDNEAATAEAKYLVRINTHAYGSVGVAAV